MTSETLFKVTQLNDPEKLREFLFQHGKEPKAVCPIYFFSEEEREKFEVKK